MNSSLNRTINLPSILIAVLAAAWLAAAAPAHAGVHAQVTNGTEVSRARYDDLWGSIVSIQSGFDGDKELLAAQGRQSGEHTGARDLHECAGTLVRPDVVVTAAHCVGPDSSWGIVGERYRVLVGTRRLLDRPAGQPGELIDVAEVRIPPAWIAAYSEDDDEDGMGWDVAVLKLEHAAGRGVPISLVAAGERQSWGAGNGLARGAFTAGWGVTNPLFYGIDDDVADDTQAVLRETAMPLLADRTCESTDSSMGASAQQFDRDTMLCGDSPDTDPNLRRSTRRGSCYGDSGGPLLVRAGVDRTPRLVGIVSWGPPTGGGCNAASVFTRVDGVRSWIDATIDSLDHAEPLHGPVPTSAVQVGANSMLVRWTPPSGTPDRIVLRREDSLWSQLSPRTREALVKIAPRFVAAYRRIRVAESIGSAGRDSRSLVVREIPPRRPGARRTVRLRLQTHDLDGRIEEGPVLVVPAPVDAVKPNLPRLRIVGRDRGVPKLAWRPVFDNDCVDRYDFQLRKIGSRRWRTIGTDEGEDCSSAEELLWGDDEDARLNALPQTTFRRAPYRVAPGRYAMRVVAVDRAGNRRMSRALVARIARRVAPPNSSCETYGSVRYCTTRKGSAITVSVSVG
ncbi:MAG: serine protease [Thermoleophilia bacterium]|nr:serine protease [Thermoleophilia bacterium]